MVPQVSEITADIRRWCREECDNMDSRMGADSYAIMLADNTAVLSVNHPGFPCICVLPRECGYP